MLEMLPLPTRRLLTGVWGLVLFIAGTLTVSAWSQTPPITTATVVEQNATALLDKYGSLATQLAGNPYGRPLFLDSSETPTRVNGNAYAVLDSPFSAVSGTFKSPKRWCDVMMLHLNTKYCRASSDASPSLLTVNIGKKRVGRDSCKNQQKRA